MTTCAMLADRSKSSRRLLHQAAQTIYAAGGAYVFGLDNCVLVIQEQLVHAVLLLQQEATARVSGWCALAADDACGARCITVTHRDWILGSKSDPSFLLLDWSEL